MTDHQDPSQPTGPTPLDAWVAALAARLGVAATDVDVRALLDLAREAAHGVDRPAAPLTTFLVGYAAGLRGGGPDAVASATADAAALVDGWT